MGGTTLLPTFTQAHGRTHLALSCPQTRPAQRQVPSPRRAVIPPRFAARRGLSRGGTAAPGRNT
eukprot:2018177-Prymnesium_polylepis.1